MNAEATLRRAAALMRERAEAATPGPWSCDDKSGIDDLHFGQVDLPVLRGPETYGPSLADTQHMAGMDPLVALAVADWLDFESEVCVNDDGQNEPVRTAALAVARTYLSEEA